MADVSTESYPKPVQSNFMDVAKGYQQLESNKLGIDKQKIDLINQHTDFLLKELNSLPANATSDDMVQVGQRALNLKAITPDIFKEYIRNMPTDPSKVAGYRDYIANRASETRDAINHVYGANGFNNNGQQSTPTKQFLRGGPVASGLPIQQQPPVGMEVATPQGPQALGAQNPQLPPGAVPASGIPGQFSPTPVKPVIVTPGSNNRLGAVPSRPSEPPMGEPASPNERVSQGFNSLQPRGPMTGQPPMFEEGKKQLAQDQEVAKTKALNNVPALQAYKMLDGLRSGPGTDTWNKTIAFAKANGIIPIDTKNDPTAIYQEVNKKLAQFVQGNGTRSDADLAKKEESSPSVKTQISPALIKLTRDAIGLNNIDVALPNARSSENLSEYGNHRSNFTKNIDPRAFTYHLLPNDEKKPLWDEMIKQTRIENGKRVPTTATAKKFFESLDIVKKQGLHLQ